MNDKIDVKVITDSKIIKDHNIQDITFTQYQNLASSIIGSIDIKDILDDDEVGIFEAEYNAPYTSEPLGATKLVVVLKATRLCNLKRIQVNVLII